MIPYQPQAYNSWLNGQFMMPEVMMPQLQVNPTNQQPQATAQDQQPFARVDNPFQDAFGGGGGSAANGAPAMSRSAENNYGAAPLSAVERGLLGLAPGGGLLGAAISANNIAANNAAREAMGNPNGLNFGQVVGGLLGLNDYGRGLSPGVMAALQAQAYDQAIQDAAANFDPSLAGADQGRSAGDMHGGGMFGGFGFDGYY